jgi:anti-anti-sigma factor
MSDYPVPEAHYITLAGEYDIARKSELAETFGTITNGLPAIIDMSQVTYADSTFLSELAAMRLRSEERPVTLVGVQPNIARLLRLTKLDRFFIFQ